MPAAASTSAAAIQPSEASAISSRTSDHCDARRAATNAAQVSPTTAPTSALSATVRRRDRPPGTVPSPRPLVAERSMGAGALMVTTGGAVAAADCQRAVNISAWPT
jgi:hypothetical protein